MAEEKKFFPAIYFLNVVCKIKLEKNKKPFVIAFLLNIPNQKKGNHK
ncbi:hypothetical protein LRI_0049 [Limosilactobacillus reuteri I5007]|jgi:hypothetical protein|uniref:Uncharacterized protein n=1 Tax=Limosilactobacillus reuteri I5007 TaxID=1340495 RepID=R9WF38_LIMRT|nr:hypothetical protein [Limosilactobacillus reuteri]AGN98258.1 hypothetical protein LRI_0049 [Limosilactobacillus reuteri I5007]MCC4392620.1 hypothetical protein [Limosilactobacillus reuteri]MCC4431083.1 hypothetical protein [Limosilactobacillus reuteri]MCC4433356.1 hypothetical protein [Limosilactobacillus reuteri]